MKKRLLFVFCTLIAFGLMAEKPKFITVNLPNGSTTWNVSTTQTITWTRDPSISGTNVKIRLMKGHGGTEDLILKITDSTANDGSYDWPIPASLTPGSYLIRVKTVDNAEYDDGDYFTLAPAPGAASITVNMPNSSSDWQRGTTKTITWTAVGSMNANVKIRLMKGHGGPEDLILKITESTSTSAGSFPWPIPASLAAGKYLIRVKTVDNAVGDDGDFFDIIIGGGSGTTPSLSKFRIISPKSGNNWHVGKSYPIRWSRLWLISEILAKKKYPVYKKEQLLEQQRIAIRKIKTVKIQYRRVNCKKFPLRKELLPKWYTIRSNAIDGKNGGTYDWFIPSAQKPGCYQIKVIENWFKGKTAVSKIFNIVLWKIKPEVLEKMKKKKKYFIPAP